MTPTEILQAAWKAVTESGVPQELHELAFSEAVRLVEAQGVQKAVPAGAPAAPLKTGGAAPAVKAPLTPTEHGEFFKELSRESGVDEAVLTDLLHLDGDDVTLLPATKDLGVARPSRSGRSPP